MPFRNWYILQMYCNVESIMSEFAIQVKHLDKMYKLYNKPSDRLKEALGFKVPVREHYALRDVSFEVKRGETVGIIGTNGSGKSTILKIITGVLNPTGGEVVVDGRISALLELGAGFNMEYTGIENVYLNGTMMGFSREEIDARLQDILDFAETADLMDVQELLELQIQCNMAISEEGLRGQWGAQVGRTMMKTAANRYQRAAAAAAAGSDARMSGCELPVVIVSGSGNQGLTASVPVIVCAREMGIGKESTLRALLVSNLITIHQKTSIGRLSAFCGATSAGVGAACGIAWLEGGRYCEIAHTIVNSLAILSGMVCDGAKPSCAAKIATAVTNGILGYQMFCNGLEFFDGDGIVTKGVENTITNIGRLANRGMRQTDQEILNIMTGR